MKFLLVTLLCLAAADAQWAITEVSSNFLEIRYDGGGMFDLSTVTFGGPGANALLSGDLSGLGGAFMVPTGQRVVIHAGTPPNCPDPQCSASGCGGGLCAAAFYVSCNGGTKRATGTQAIGTCTFQPGFTGGVGAKVGPIGFQMDFETAPFNGGFLPMPWSFASFPDAGAMLHPHLMTPGAPVKDFDACESLADNCEQRCIDKPGPGAHVCACNDTQSALGADGESCGNPCGSAGCPAMCINEFGGTHKCVNPQAAHSAFFGPGNAGPLEGVTEGGFLFFDPAGNFIIGNNNDLGGGEAIEGTCAGEEPQEFTATVDDGFLTLDFDYICDEGMVAMVETFIDIADENSPLTQAMLMCDGASHTYTKELPSVATGIKFTMMCEEGGVKRAGETISIDDIGVTNGGGSISGDPHLVGFDGEKYDLKGEDGKVFNLISDLVLNVNTLLFVPAADVEGTFIESVGIVTEAGNVFVHKNMTTKVGETVMKKTQVVKSGSLKVETSEESVKVTVEQYSATIKFIRDETMGYARYLNIDFGISGMPYDIHGFLGQSARSIIGLEAADQQVEGEESDYEVVDGLFGSDFKFNRFAQKVKRSALNAGQLENEIVAEFH